MVRFEVGAHDAVAAKGKAAGGAAAIGGMRVAVIAGLDTQVHETIAAEGESAKASAGIKGRIVAIVAGFALLNDAVTTAGEAGTSMTDEPHGAVGVRLANGCEWMDRRNDVDAGCGRKQYEHVQETKAHGADKLTEAEGFDQFRSRDLSRPFLQRFPGTLQSAF